MHVFLLCATLMKGKDDGPPCLPNIGVARIVLTQNAALLSVQPHVMGCNTHDTITLIVLP
jgi:hypothetical protein